MRLPWPQPDSLREAGKNTWEFDAHFGVTGDHTIHIVTANELGRSLIEYYRKVVRLNVERRGKLAMKLDKAELCGLGGDHPGIPMAGLPKGLRSEASVNVTIAERPE